MTPLTLEEHLKTLPIIPNEKLEPKYTYDKTDMTLEEDEYMLKVSGGTGFMAKINKNKTLPTSFIGWRSYYKEEDKTKEILQNGSGGYLFKSDDVNDLVNKYKQFDNDTDSNIKNKKLKTLKISKNYTCFNHYVLFNKILKLI